MSNETEYGFQVPIWLNAVCLGGLDKAVLAGTLVGTYFVLPEDVQFHETDYINDSFREICSARRGQSL